MTQSRTLAVIAARGGSKRIPRKNIRPFLGKPVIRYSIEAALAAQCFDEVMVSTDDPEIREIALQTGAAVPFLRSEDAANDHAGLEEVLLEVLHGYEALGRRFDAVCLLLPTAPFVTSTRLLTGLNMLNAHPEAEAVIPVVRLGPIQRALTVRNGYLGMLWPEFMHTRSNDLEPAYQDCGQFYWVRTQAFMEYKEIYLPRSLPLEIPELETQDIDTEADWQLAEFKYRLLGEPARTE